MPRVGRAMQAPVLETGMYSKHVPCRNFDTVCSWGHHHRPRFLARRRVAGLNEGVGHLQRLKKKKRREKGSPTRGEAKCSLSSNPPSQPFDSICCNVPPVTVDHNWPGSLRETVFSPRRRKPKSGRGFLFLLDGGDFLRTRSDHVCACVTSAGRIRSCLQVN